MKEIIFNYFLSKVAQKEQELLGIKDAKASLLAVIYANVRVFRRYPSGCTMETVLVSIPNYAQELFLNLCLEAEKQDNHLMKAFDFEVASAFYHGGEFPILRDKGITEFLEKSVYPLAQNKDKAIEVYKALNQDKKLNFKKMIRSDIRDVNVIQQEIPTQEEVRMIDEAWDHLTKNEHFINLLQPFGKYDQYARSHAYMAYGQEFKFLELRAAAKWCNNRRVTP